MAEMLSVFNHSRKICAAAGGLSLCVCQIKGSWIPTLRGNKSDEVAVAPQALTLMCRVLPVVGARNVISSSGWRSSSCDAVEVFLCVGCDPPTAPPGG